MAPKEGEKQQDTTRAPSQGLPSPLYRSSQGPPAGPHGSSEDSQSAPDQPGNFPASACLPAGGLSGCAGKFMSSTDCPGEVVRASGRQCHHNQASRDYKRKIGLEIHAEAVSKLARYLI